MNTILAFLLWCVGLALLVGIGSAVLNLLFTVGMMLIVGIISGISWVWQKLTGNEP